MPVPLPCGGQGVARPVGERSRRPRVFCRRDDNLALGEGPAIGCALDVGGPEAWARLQRRFSGVPWETLPHVETHSGGRHVYAPCPPLAASRYSRRQSRRAMARPARAARRSQRVPEPRFDLGRAESPPQRAALRLARAVTGSASGAPRMTGSRPLCSGRRTPSASGVSTGIAGTARGRTWRRCQPARWDYAQRRPCAPGRPAANRRRGVTTQLFPVPAVVRP